MKRRTVIALCAVVCLVLCFAIGCTPGANNSAGQSQSGAGSNESQQGGQPSLEDLTKNTIQATITMEDGGIIIL